MSSYVIRAQYFLSMSWEWKQSFPPIYVYFLYFWETSYKHTYERIYNNFFAPLWAILTFDPTPYMLQYAMDVVSKEGDWYVSSSGVYIHIYGSMKEPHQVPHNALENVILLKFDYQTYVNGFGESMKRKKKNVLANIKWWRTLRYS